MNALVNTFLIMLGLAGMHGSPALPPIDNCYLSFPGVKGLVATTPDRLPETADKFRALGTEHGEVTVSRIDGYRILYKNDRQAPFVNLKVELCDSQSFKADKAGILDNLRYLNSHSEGMEGTDLIEMN